MQPLEAFRDYPCHACGGPVALLSGRCLICKAMHIVPQPGPQSLFLANEAEVVLFGGAAYGGKTFALLLDVLRYHQVPGWRGTVMRRHDDDYNKQGSIFEKAVALFTPLGARVRLKAPRDIRFPSGASLAFEHVSEENLHTYQGIEFAWLGIEEATHFPLSHILYLITRMRTECGSSPRVRMTCNPDAGHALREWVDPYVDSDGYAIRDRSGMVRYWTPHPKTGEIVWGDTPEEAAEASGRPVSEIKSFSFIPALPEDNPIGLKSNPGYLANLSAGGPVEEAKLRGGNWNAKADVCGMIDLTWFGRVTEPIAPIVYRQRSWDMASTAPRPSGKRSMTDPDYTVGVRKEWDVHGRWYITDVVACREEATERDLLMARTAEADGPNVTQVLEREGGAGGKDAMPHWIRTLKSSGNCGPIVPVPSSGSGGKIVKVNTIATELRLGMDGNTPRKIPIELDPTGSRSARGFIMLNGWMERPYRDASRDHPRTLGALFEQQMGAFATAGVHDDVPDAAAIGHHLGSRPRPRIPDAYSRALTLIG